MKYARKAITLGLLMICLVTQGFSQRLENSKGMSGVWHFGTPRLGRESRESPAENLAFKSVFRVPVDFAVQTSQKTLSRNVQFNEIVVARRDGQALMGMLVGFIDDTLLVLVVGRTERIPLPSVARLRIERGADPASTKAGVYGMLLGAYGGNLAVYTARQEPFAYLRNFEGVWILTTALLGGAGGWIGYTLGSASEGKEEVFDFTGNEGQQREELSRFRQFVIAQPSLRKFHISFQAGQVDTRRSNASDAYRPYYYYPDYYTGDVSNFNALRNLELTVSVTDEVEVGGSLVWFGEPTLGWQGNYGSYSPANHTSGYEQFKAIGYYLVAYYKPFEGWLPRIIGCKIGLGLGSADVDFRSLRTENIWDSTATPYPQYRNKETVDEIKGTFFSVVINTHVDLYLFDGLSLGFVVDYVYVPNKVMPAIAEVGLGTRDLGNSSIGFILGIHF